MALERQPDGGDGARKLTGKHVLAIIIAFFGFVFLVDGSMTYMAIHSFSGTATDSSYLSSQTFNAELAAGRAQAARGWAVKADAKRAADGVVTVAVDAHDAGGQPIGEVEFRATLQRPTVRSADHILALAPVVGAAGAYRATAEAVAAGQWDLVIEATGKEGRLFLSRSRIYFAE